MPAISTDGRLYSTRMNNTCMHVSYTHEKYLKIIIPVPMIDQICYWLQKGIFNADFPVRSARKLIGFSKCVPFDPFCTPCFQMKRSLCAPTFNEETFIFVSKFLLRVISFFLPKLLRSFFAIRLLVLFCPAPVCL